MPPHHLFKSARHLSVVHHRRTANVEHDQFNANHSISQCRLQRHDDLPILHLDWIGTHAPLWPGEALARGDVELHRMPRAGQYLALKAPLELPMLFRARSQRAGDAPLAEWPRLVNADIRQRVELAVHVEDANLALANRDDTALAFADVAGTRDDMFTGHSAPRCPAQRSGPRSRP